MGVGADQKSKHLYEFGPFRVDAEKEILFRDGQTVPLAPKTFQILLVLMRHSKNVVTKDDLIKIVWPDTFVEEANLSQKIFLLRKALGESPQDHQYILTVPGCGYRFAEDVRLVPEQELNIVAASRSKVQVQVNGSKPWPWVGAAMVLVVAVAAGTFRLFLHPSSALTEKDTVVLADFVNSTGDPVFDGTLRQGLSVQLEQSPFLSLISDERIRQTLRLMGQLPDARLTPEIVHDLCRRTQSAAVINGSIANLGTQYVVGLKAVSCRTGDVLADEQETADGKEKILGALDKSAIKLRERLGESLSTVEKFDTPLEQATTSSLEALEAYTMGRKMMIGEDRFFEAIPFFERAIRLDPKFALAYTALGSTYWNLTENTVGTEYVRKSYELHAPVSEPEKFNIEYVYYRMVTGDLEKTRQIGELWAQTYPRYARIHLSLCVLYWQLGRYDNALEEIREAIRLDPSQALSYSTLVSSYIYLNRLEEARATADEVLQKQFDSAFLRMTIYRLSFLENNPAGMAEQLRWAAGKRGTEGLMLEWEAQTAAYFGLMNKARDISRNAIESAMRAQQKETAAQFYANQAFWESLFGSKADARSCANSGLALSSGREMQYVAALGLALAGEEGRTQTLADDLAKGFPEDTMVQFNYLPSIRAQIALNHADSSKAVELLRPTAPYELGNHWWSLMGPIYVRGDAYLVAHRGAQAAAEFQKILDHRGIVGNHPFGALAHLQLGRAYTIAGDKNKAKSAYQDFLNLWKDADPDILILKQAKAEYAKLQ